VIVLLLIVAALLYFPTLRRAVGAYLFGVLFMFVMALTLGSAGVLIALAIGVVAFVRGFWRPAR
jgi:hypothetical protein